MDRRTRRRRGASYSASLADVTWIGGRSSVTCILRLWAAEARVQRLYELDIGEGEAIMPNQKKAGQAGRKGGSVIDDELNKPTPSGGQKKTGKKQSKGKQKK